MLNKNTALWIEELIEANKDIFIFHNTNVDPDGVSSAYALAKLIKTNYPKKNINVVTDVNDFINKLSYLGEKIDWDEFAIQQEEEVLDENGNPVNNGPKKKDYLALVLGGAKKNTIKWYESYKDEIKKTVIINHYDSVTDIDEVDLSWNDTTYTTTSSMIELLARTLDWKINKDIAYLLMHGLIVGTQQFAITNGNATAFTTISNLMEIIGVKPYEEILSIIKLRTKNHLEFEKYVLENLTIKAGIAHVAIDAATMNEMKIDDYFYNQIDIIGNIEEVNYWVMFVETNRGTEMEIRSASNDYRVDYTAKEFGGEGTKTSGSALLDKFSDHKEVMKFLNRDAKARAKK